MPSSLPPFRRRKKFQCFLAYAILPAFLCAPPLAFAQAHTTIRFDASQPYSAPGPALYSEGSATSPLGSTLGVNSRYLTLDGKPWLPVMGEFHFSRYPRAEWEEELLKMKAAGVNIVSTYVIWIHHEEIKGQFDWTGQRDLRAFAELCAKHGLYLLPRIGPWDHAEVRNGGLPDWMIQQSPTRVNNPIYLASVRAWYGQIGEQLKGLLFKDGGPVLGIQLENEYSKRGPGAGQAHILELKKIAIASGLDVPLYVVTGWDDAVVPRGAVIPVYGGYPAAPWTRTTGPLPPQEVYAFRFASRVAANEDISASPSMNYHAGDSLPFLTAELGGGNEVTYHRRPVIAARDVAAMVPVMLGSGVNLYGTYMFQGGENPDGKLSTLEESQATGYPNDVPIKSYDFQAPLGEFGQERKSFRQLKVFNYFLNDFGGALAPMTVHPPQLVPHHANDLFTPRAAVRSRGTSGFIFFNNYVRGYAMPERRSTQFAIRLPGNASNTSSELLVPRHPIDLPAGSFFIWPFNLRLGSATLRYSTAQLFTQIENGGRTTVYFEALPGIAPQFAFGADGVRSVEAPGAATVRDGGVLYVSGLQPGMERYIRVVPRKGPPLRIVVLTAREAEHAWKVRIDGRDHLLITPQEIVPNSEAGTVRLLAEGSPEFRFTLLPPATGPLAANLKLRETTKTAEMASYTAEAQPRTVSLTYQLVHPAGVAPPVQFGPAAHGSQGVAEAPPAGPLPNAGQWTISIPRGSLAGVSNLYLTIDYQGDIARLTANQRLLDDNFYNGKPWTIGLKRFLHPDGSGRFRLSILPLRRDAPVYFELSQPAKFARNGQAVGVSSIRLVPEYSLNLGAAEAPDQIHLKQSNAQILRGIRLSSDSQAASR